MSEYASKRGNVSCKKACWCSRIAESKLIIVLAVEALLVIFFAFFVLNSSEGDVQMQMMGNAD